MESIKSNIDLIFDDWNSSQPKITQKRLSFDFMNNSGETTRNLDSGSSECKNKDFSIAIFSVVAKEFVG
jgi:hypothetical protein